MTFKAPLENVNYAAAAMTLFNSARDIPITSFTSGQVQDIRTFFENPKVLETVEKLQKLADLRKSAAAVKAA